jgi:hypothetical protein
MKAASQRAIRLVHCLSLTAIMLVAPGCAGLTAKQGGVSAKPAPKPPETEMPHPHPNYPDLVTPVPPPEPLPEVPDEELPIEPLERQA